MDRLTVRSKQTTHENGVCCAHFNSPECSERRGLCVDYCPWEEKVWERLAAYEDTGLTPEQIMTLLEADGIEENGHISERLTIPDVRLDAHTTRRTIIDAGKVRENAMAFYWRLKAYEDIGLTPEQLKATCTAGTMLKIAAQILDTTPEHMKALLEADRAARRKEE